MANAFRGRSLPNPPRPADHPFPSLFPLPSSTPTTPTVPLVPRLPPGHPLTVSTHPPPHLALSSSPWTIFATLLHFYLFTFLPGKPRAPKEIGCCFPLPFEKKLEAACFGRLTQTPSLPDLVLTPASSPSQSLGSRRSLDHHTTTAGLVKIDFARRGSGFTTFCFWIVISSTLSLPKGCTLIASISPLLPPMCCLHRTTCV